MKMKNSWKKLVSVVLTLAVIVSAVSVSSVKKADAAAKSYTAYLMFTDKDWTVQNFEKSIGNTTVKGSGTYTVTLTKKALTAAFKKNGQGWATGVKCGNAIVFNVDVVDICKDYKPSKIKISNVKIKVDGKDVKINSKKLNQGNIEDDGNNYRLEIYNIYGDTAKNGKGDGSDAADACAKGSAFKFKKSLSVTFSIKY